MSDQPTMTEDQIIDAAKAEFIAFQAEFEQKWNYGIGAVSKLTPDGRIETLLQLIPLPPKPEEVETPAEDLPVEDNAQETEQTSPESNTETA